MLSVYTRHSKNCAKKEDINWRRCRCPKWINGTLDSRFIRKTAKTRSWEKAEELKRQLEEAATPKKLEPVTIEEAVGAYLADAKARELRESTLYKLEILFRRQFLAWAKDKGLCFLKEIDLPLLRDYRATWKDGALAKKKKQERLIGFFWFCVRAGWLTTNPTQGLGKIAVDPTPTDYFTPKEIDAILDATYVYRENRWEQGDRNGTRLRALTLLMRWSGLRIRDAITLERSRLVGGHQGAHASLYHFIPFTVFESHAITSRQPPGCEDTSILHHQIQRRNLRDLLLDDLFSIVFFMFAALLGVMAFHAIFPADDRFARERPASSAPPLRYTALIGGSVAR